MPSSGPPLGWQHKRQRKALLAAHVDGTPCPMCGRPMYRGITPMDADHSLPRVLGGRVADRLVCSPCNRRAGQRLSTQRRAQTKAATRVQPRTSRDW